MNTFDNIVYKVTDLEAAKALHEALLGTPPHTDQPYYVGFNVGGVEIGLSPTEPDETAGGVPHIRVDDMDQAIRKAQEVGATLVTEPRDVGGGNLVATLSDPDGTHIGLIHRAN